LLGRDADEPGYVLERGVEQGEHRVEREESAEVGVALEAACGHARGLVERPLCVGHDARGEHANFGRKSGRLGNRQVPIDASSY
jgi:hypothetical protein